MSFGASAQAVAHVQSYAEAEAFLGDKDSRKICGNNTYVERREDGDIAIRLHQTDIITFVKAAAPLIVLNTDGWHTLITKQRLEQFLPAPLRVMSFKGQWRISFENRYWAKTRAECANSAVFTDGLRLIWNTVGWEALNGLTPEAEDRLNTAKRELDKTVKRYIKKLERTLPKWTQETRDSNQLSVAGDPWCCTMGIGQGDKDHLWQHLKDGYVFPTIVVRAFEDSGRWDRPDRPAAQAAVNHIAYGIYDSITREVAKYLRKQLDPFTSKEAAAVDPKSNAALERYVDVAKTALEYPDSYAYFGKDTALYKTSAPTFGRNRDSENVEIANYEIVWETLCAEFPDLVATTDLEQAHTENPGGIYVHGASHWACGWIEQIVVPVLRDPDKPLGPTNLHPAFIRVTELAEQVKLYPALPGAEERAGLKENEQILSDITSWQDFLADKGDPFVKAFTAEQLLKFTDDMFGDRAYAWYYEGDSSGPGVRDLHLLACWQDSLAQVDGQEVLV